MRYLTLFLLLSCPLHAQEDQESAPTPAVWSYKIHPQTRAIERAKPGYYSVEEQGDYVVVSFPGPRPMDFLDRDGLPSRAMACTIRPITSQEQFPYRVQHTSLLVEKALDGGDLERARELMRELRGLTPEDPAEVTKDVTETSREPLEESEDPEEGS